MAKRATGMCPLCHGGRVSKFMEVDAKLYWRCRSCLLTFMDVAHRLPPEAEYKHYLSHENDVNDPGYRSFLSKLADPLLERLPQGSNGLDYGCGPGPALAQILCDAGHGCALYDPFFARNARALDGTYDYVTCTEVAEHFHDPGQEFQRFDQLLRTGGWLGLMTCFQTDDDKFVNWHYRQDPTHVAFYRCETLAFVADQMGWAFESPAKDVVLMRKPC